MKPWCLLQKAVLIISKRMRLDEACRTFLKRDGKFIRGDLDLFIFDSAGICYLYGDDFDLIWRSLFNINDDDETIHSLIY